MRNNRNVVFMEEYEENRAEWVKLYDYYFKKEKNYLKFSSIFESISIVTALINVFLSYFLDIFYPTEFLFLFSSIVLISSLIFAITTYIASLNRKKGELGRRTSFYIGLIPISKLQDTILRLEKSIDNVHKNSKPDWYIEDSNDDSIKAFCLNFLESVYFQNHLMIKYKEKLYKTSVISISIAILYVISIFMIIINSLNIGIMILSISTIVIVVPVLFNQIMKSLNFKDKERKISEIYNQLYKLCNIPKPKQSWVIFEGIRLFQEYSVVLQNILPVPDTIYLKYKNKIKKEIIQIIDNINQYF